MADINLPNLDRLKAQLQTSNLSQTNQPLFQVINQLIDSVKQGINQVNANIETINNAVNHITQLTVIQQIINSDSGVGDNDVLIIPGPPGPTGVIGPMGPVGAILFLQDNEIPNDELWFKQSNPAVKTDSNYFSAINPIITANESWLGPSALNGVYFKNGNIGHGTTNPTFGFDFQGTAALAWGGFQMKDTTAGGGIFSITTFNGAVANAVAGDILFANTVGNIIISPNAAGKSVFINGGVFTAVPFGFTVSPTNVCIFGAQAQLAGYTVATLPAGTLGQVVFANDLLGPTFLAIAVGGGAVKGPVFYNGANWVTF